MKILNIDSFNHSQNEIEHLKAEAFQPIRDHKIKLELYDNSIIEAGVFEIITDGKHEMHACISTQAGCKFGCHFCSSGKNGWKRDLSWEEILEEISILIEAFKLKSFNRIMYMGIGEPLDNFSNVVTSIRYLLDKFPCYNKNISLATIGIISKLNELALLNLPLRMLWVSLHAASDEKRMRIMPIGKSSKVKEVISATISFAKTSKIQTWINYMILHDFNDQIEDAKMLIDLLKDTEEFISVMITTPNGTVPGYTSGSIEDVYRFQKLLVSEGLVNKTVRFFAIGQPVNAGCGEFVFYPTEK